jgi:hypothetical protein
LWHTDGLLLKENSENAQRELRDSVMKSLYADEVREMFLQAKKWGRVPNWNRGFDGAGGSQVRGSFVQVYVLVG